jgi:superfamily II DNA/RNA helicase
VREPGREPSPGRKRAIEKLLSGIGVPEQKALKPDDFQLEALAAIEHEDVLVTAPTGSGKTWIAREEIRRLLDDSYLLRPASAERFFRDAIDQLYANGEAEHLAALRRLVERLYPPGKTIGDFQRQRLAEAGVRTVYLHAHMDEDTLDCSRAMLCPDLVPAEPGRLIPACTYNLFYRMQDSRFYVPPPGRGAAP